MKRFPCSSCILAAVLICGASLNLNAQGTAFTYQGRLLSGASPANGTYDLTFALFSVNAGAGQVGSTQTNLAVAVSNGLFIVALDFGANFPGADRWLEIGVRTNGPGAFTTLTPRQRITSAPYAITASNLTGTLPSTQLSGIVPLTQLPSAVITNNAAGATLTGNFFGNFGGSFFGSGAGLTGLNPTNLNAGTAAINITGNAATATIAVSATNLLGNVTDAQISANIPRLNGTNSFTGSNTFTGVLRATNVNNVIRRTFTGSGAGLSNLNTAQFTGVVLTNNQSGVTLSGNFTGSGAGLSNVNAATLNGLNATNFWRTSGNGGTTTGAHFLGTTDNQAFEIKVNGGRALRIEPNVSAAPNLIGGSPVNFVLAGVQGAVIAGGGTTNFLGLAYTNSVSSGFGSIGGGMENTIQRFAEFTTIGGGYRNTIWTNADSSTIGGGYGNAIQPDALYSTIGGGSGNTIQSDASRSTIDGGENNTIGASRSTVGGGGDNSILSGATDSTIGGGLGNWIQLNAEYSTIGGGYGNTVAGDYGTISGGDENLAGANSFAAGHRAKATHTGSFVWADSTEADFATTADKQFLIRASGGVGINTTNPSAALSVSSATGAQGFRLVGSRSGNFAAQLAYIENTNAPGVSSGPALRLLGYGNAVDGVLNVGLVGTGKIMAWGGNSGEVANVTSNGTFNALAFNPSSDRNLKENFAPVNSREVLDKVATLLITRWNFKSESTTPHLGPMAQDFHAAFGVGTDERHIATVDADGVALAAIQGLNEKVEMRSEKLEVRSRKSEDRIEKLEAENAELRQRLERLESLLGEKLASVRK